MGERISINSSTSQTLWARGHLSVSGNISLQTW